MTDSSFGGHYFTDENPSVEKWELELERLLAGGRALNIVALGDAQEYIESVLIEAKDAEISKLCFKLALRIIVSEWRVEPFSSRSSASCMLDLIEAYKPREGFVRLIEFLSIGSIDAYYLKADSWYPVAHDLHLKALFVVQSYFPAPPLAGEDDLAFKAYVRVLRQSQVNKKYVGYASFRLLDLGIVRPGDETIVEKVCQTPRAMSDFVSCVLSLRPECTQEFIQPTYWEVLRRGGEYGLWLSMALRSVGARLENGENGAIIILSDNGIVDLDLPAGDWLLQHKYMISRHQWESQEGFHAMEEVLSYVSAHTL